MQNTNRNNESSNLCGPMKNLLHKTNQSRKKNTNKTKYLYKNDRYNYYDKKNDKKIYLVKLYLCISHSLEYILFSDVKLVREKQFTNNQTTSFV